MTEAARVTTATPPGRQLVLAVAALMIAAQTGLRAWALFPSWFYADDYEFLMEARDAGFGWSYLTEPFDNQLMPLGRAVAWLVAHSGDANWELAATITLAGQVLASSACLWMLDTCFGSRWTILVPLGLYLWLAVPVPAQMWWAASLNQMPLQVVFFASAAAWVSYARTRRVVWLAATMLVLAVGLTAYVKTVLVFGVLAFVLLAYFSRGGLYARIRGAVREYWPALALSAVIGSLFAWYYTTHVPSIFEPTGVRAAGRLADSMIGTSLGSGLVGGPWRWDDVNPPVVGADPPPWAVHLSWVVIAALVLALALRRSRTGRAWALLVGYTATTFLLLATSRAPFVGEIAGLQYRYLTDVLPIAVLCLGLATMELVGAAKSSAPRPTPRLAVVPPARLVAGLVVVVCVSGAVSTARYVHVWHTDNPGDRYTHEAMAGLRGQGPVDLADQVVPDNVMPGFSAPHNTTERLLPLLVDNARFPALTSRLVVLTDTGTPRRALIQPAAQARPGPVRDCGWPVRQGRVTIPLTARTFDFVWWIRIGYLSSADDTMSVAAAEMSTVVPVQRGPHSMYVRVTGEVSSVTLGGLSPGSTVCVDTVEVGNPVPGGAL